MPSNPYWRAVSCFSRSESPGMRRDWTASRIIGRLLLAPPHRGRLFAERRRLQCRRRAPEAVERRGQAVLVLDREHVVVADDPERRSEPLPEQQVVAIADAAEDPAPLRDVAVGLEVEDAVDRGVVRVDRGVLRVNVEDGVAEL